MSKLSKTLLAATGIGLITGLVFSTDLINVQNMPFCFVALPLGAIFAGLFLISRMLENEIALYDEEHKSHPAATTERSKGYGRSGPPPGLEFIFGHIDPSTRPELTSPRPSRSTPSPTK
jgi:hypothetical protein